MISNVSVSQAGARPSGGYTQETSAQRESATKTDPATDAATDNEAQLSEAQRKQLRELKARDLEVRAHEQAHLSAAGGYAQGGPTFTYQKGPDGHQYAVGGEVQIDSSKVANDPVATLRKAQVIRRAALAPTNPSAQDRSVAAEAASMAAEAQAEITAQSTQGAEENKDDATTQMKQDKAQETGGCPACGGAHSSDAHEGMMAYAAPITSQTQSVSNIV